MQDKIQQAAEMILNAGHVTAFTGAGISVESGIPPFRGQDGLWNTYNPIFLEINYFLQHPQPSWEMIKKIFFDSFSKAQPNAAHKVLARMEQAGLLQAIITQNIDNLHQKAGSKTVYEYHGNSQKLICLGCGEIYNTEELSLEILPPMCPGCKGLIKPDFVFFGEPIPEPANSLALHEAEIADLVIIIGSTGEVMPAAGIPPMASHNKAKIVEINVEPSYYTHHITDLFIQGRATEVMSGLAEALHCK